MRFSRLLCCFAILLSCTCFAQMYTVIDLGVGSSPRDINFGGQIVGNLNGHGFLWTTGNGFQDLGTLTGGTFSNANAINDLGAVTGTADGVGTLFSPFGNQVCSDLTQPFVWTQSTGMQGLGNVYLIFDPGLDTCDSPIPFYGSAINNMGQVVGYTAAEKTYQYGFLWTSADGITDPGFFNWPPSFAIAISNTGQIVGQDSSGFISIGWAKSIENGVGTYLVMLGGGAGCCYGSSAANGVNDSAQVVGWSSVDPVPPFSSGFPIHAVLWSPGGQIRDLGTLASDSTSAASRINAFGEVIGSSGNMNYLLSDGPFEYVGRPFIWSESNGMTDLNTLVSPDSGWILNSTKGINSSGQIVGEGTLNGQPHGFLLNPIYTAFVQQPVNGDGSSVFSAKRGVVPLKFTLMQYGASACASFPATIAISRTAGGTFGTIDESTYLTNADSGTTFRIAGCQYAYNLASSSLGVGTYRVDISINGIMVGHAVFALE